MDSKGEDRELAGYFGKLEHWPRGYMAPGKIMAGRCGVLDLKRGFPQLNQPTLQIFTEGDQFGQMGVDCFHNCGQLNLSQGEYYYLVLVIISYQFGQM